MSRLVDRWLKQWADGRISSTELQGLCSDAKLDGLAHPMVCRFASARSGKSAHVDIMESFGEQTHVLDLIDKLEGTPADATCVMLPSKVISALFIILPRAAPSEVRGCRRQGACILAQVESKAVDPPHAGRASDVARPGRK
jgi:hypothetical protein